jgi:16S rRNA (cytosine967-C5)-methyltransferase
MTAAGNQARTFLVLLDEIRPFVRTDRHLPARIHQRLARERRFGSRDRRLYRELLYAAIRYWPWVETLRKRSDDEALRAIVWLAADVPAVASLKQQLSVGGPASAPSSVAAQAAQLRLTETPLPDWFQAHCPALFTSPNLDVVQTRAPFWLRLQTDMPDSVFAEFDQLGWQWRRANVLPSAVELLSEADVTKTKAFIAGKIEIQDLGSQLLLETVQPTPGGRWLDACAGAGGKTLQLARILGTSGSVDATDPRRAALEELQLRAARAALRNIAILARFPESSGQAGSYDGVLVDAPCSGSGTWRRAPHLKWCTSENDLALAAKRQAEILGSASAQVRSGGLLVYATCSLSPRENEDVVANFLANTPDFALAVCSPPFSVSPGPFGVTWLPAEHNTDGYFVCALRRR